LLRQTYPIAPCTLGGVQRHIGSLQEVILTIDRGIRGDADTDRERAARHVFFTWKCIAFHLLTQALTDFLRADTVGLRENDRELFPAIAGDSVGGATHLL